jgi:hypothetical protein
MALDSAKEYADGLDTLTDDEKTALKTTLDDLTVDSPQTPVAAQRFKGLLKKAGPAAATVIQAVITNVITQEAKRWMGL